MPDWGGLPPVRSAALCPEGIPVFQTGSIRLSQNQYLRPRPGARDVLLIVIEGVVVIEALLPDGRRQVMDFRFPGESISPGFNEILPGSGMRAAAPACLMEVRYTRSDDTARNGSPAPADLQRVAALQLERQALHNLILGRLTPEERVASFLVELAIRSGQGQPQAQATIARVGRTDAADYLCMNADTYSRLISRFRREGLISGRGRSMAVRDFSRLCAMTPLAGAIIDRFATAIRPPDQRVPEQGESCGATATTQDKAPASDPGQDAPPLQR